MGIKLEWLNHSRSNSNKLGGIARFKIGEDWHHLHVASPDTAIKLHKLLQQAHSAGVKNGCDLSAALEAQRVSDWLGGS